jgi:phosphoglycerate dehydrogenase-like enzyme
VLSQSDVISLHIPLTAETKEMVNASFINRCKRGFILINTSRGKNVDLGALVSGLQSGQVGGACLDVFASEPPASGPEDFKQAFGLLCGMNNVVLSPHVAGWTVESKQKITAVLLNKIREGILQF